MRQHKLLTALVNCTTLIQSSNKKILSIISEKLASICVNVDIRGKSITKEKNMHRQNKRRSARMKCHDYGAHEYTKRYRDERS